MLFSLQKYLFYMDTISSVLRAFYVESELAALESTLSMGWSPTLCFPDDGRPAAPVAPCPAGGQGRRGQR